MHHRSYWLVFALLLTTLTAVGGIDHKMKNTLKVQHILKKIQRHTPKAGDKNLIAEVTQGELNDYIGHRISREKNPQIKSLKVVLLKGNQIKGKIRSNAEHLNLGVLFGDLLDIDFMGTLHTRSGKAKLDFSAVQLNGLSINPQMLDTIIDAAARYNGTETSSISDWYELPKGIKRVLVDKGKAVLHY